jgi:hypothetical protein
MGICKITHHPASAQGPHEFMCMMEQEWVPLIELNIVCADYGENRKCCYILDFE